jgi:hypothetical protein
MAMQIPRASSGRVLVPAAVAAVAVAAVLTTVASTRWSQEQPVAGTPQGRPAAPLETQVVKAPALARHDTSVSGGPPAPDAGR